MKKLLLTAALALVGMFQVMAQSYSVVNTLVVDTNGAPIGNQMVYVQIGTGAGSYQVSGATMQNGYYVDSIANLSSVTTITTTTIDCNFDTITSAKTYSPNNFSMVDTLVINCGSSSGPTCMAMYTSTTTASNPLMLGFTNLSQGGSVMMPANYGWSFGDGTSSNQANPTHTYASAGVYMVCLTVSTIDPQTQAVICTDTYCDSVSVGSTPGGSACNASYYLDSAMSGAGNIFIWNNSTPAQTATGNQVTYNWDFGDGNSSTQAYPSHTYAASGIYTVCLTISVYSPTGLACADTFCHNLGVDSLGNIYYKTTGPGFTLNVVDPATVGQQEFEVSNLNLFPNPANDEVFMSFASAPASVKWQITDLKGSTLISGSESGSEKVRLDVSSLIKGVYLIQVLADDQVQNSKLIIE